MESPASKRKVGRPPKYNWNDKRDLCYRLYVEEQRSATEVAKYFVEQLQVPASELPCRKGFLRQFNLWNFPSHNKKLSVENELLVSNRIQELWHQNVNQKDIKRTLQEEGWEIKDYDFTKIWRKNNLRLRHEQGYKPPDPENKKKRKRTSTADDTILPELEAELQAAAAAATEPAPDENDDDPPIVAPIGPEEAARRQQRLLELQHESDQKMATKKRRRRIRGYGHLPPDAPGTAPRYNSETSLDECKSFLHLTNDMYQTVRRDYQAICEQMGIIKKTKCADGIWEESKRALIRDNMHLSAMMHPLQPDQDKKNIALDCLCSDVTKRMRVSGKAITIADANNIIGLSPQESKAIRRTLYEILAAANFESRLVSGEEEWQSFRKEWLSSNEKMQQAAGENDSKKNKAVDLLCSDAMKRFREDKNKRGEREIVQKNAKYGPGPGPAWAIKAPRSKAGAEARAAQEAGIDISQPRARAAVQGRGYPPLPNGQFLGTLAQATGDVDFDLDPALANAPSSFLNPPAPPQPLDQPIPVYFKLATNSTVTGNHPKTWLGKLNIVSIEALHTAAAAKSAASNVSKVIGIVKNEDGTEDNYQIDQVDELQAYLDAAGEKPTFAVLLENGHA